MNLKVAPLAKSHIKFQITPYILKTVKFTKRILRPEVLKLFSHLTQLSTKFILFINVKMPTLVGILTFISMINATSEILEARHFFICRYFTFLCAVEILCSVELSIKKFYNLLA